MLAENNSLDPYQSPLHSSRTSGGSRIRSAKFTMYGVWACVAVWYASIYTEMLLGGNHFFGLVKSNETAWFYADIAGRIGLIAIVAGVACFVYSLFFGNLKTRLACVITAIILMRFFMRIASHLFTKMLDWL